MQVPQLSQLVTHNGLEITFPLGIAPESTKDLINRAFKAVAFNQVHDSHRAEAKALAKSALYCYASDQFEEARFLANCAISLPTKQTTE